MLPPALSHYGLGERDLHAPLSLSYFMLSRPCITALTLPTCPPTKPWGVPGFSHHVSTAYTSSCFHIISLLPVLSPVTGGHRTSPLISTLVCVSVADFYLPAWGSLSPAVTPLLTSPPATGLPFKGAFTLKPVLCPAHLPSKSSRPQPSCCNSRIQTFTACSSIHSPVRLSSFILTPFGCVTKLFIRTASTLFQNIYNFWLLISWEVLYIFPDHFVSFRNCTHSVWHSHIQSQTYITKDSRVLGLYIVKIC